MGQSLPILDQKTYQGTAAASGGTFVADYPIPADVGARLVAVAVASIASGGHLASLCSLRAEYVVEHNSAAVNATTVQAGSSNPLNSNTTGEATAHVQAQDATFVGGSPSILSWSISGTNARATFTNFGAVTANVTIVISAILVGST